MKTLGRGRRSVDRMVNHKMYLHWKVPFAYAQELGTASGIVLRLRGSALPLRSTAIAAPLARNQIETGSLTVKAAFR